MKKVLVFLAIWFFVAAPAWGAPWLISDPDTTTNPPSYYKVTVDSGTAVQSPAQTVTGGVRLHYDVASLNLLQNHNFSVTACKTDSIGQEVCSAAAVFQWSASTAPAKPSGVKLEQ